MEEKTDKTKAGLSISLNFAASIRFGFAVSARYARIAVPFISITLYFIDLEDFFSKLMATVTASTPYFLMLGRTMNDEGPRARKYTSYVYKNKSCSVVADQLGDKTEVPVFVSTDPILTKRVAEGLALVDMVNVFHIDESTT